MTEEAKTKKYVVMYSGATGFDFVGIFFAQDEHGALAKALESTPSRLELERVEIKLIDHECKIDKEFYDAVQDGSKPFEIRNNDRNFQTGQIVLLREFDQKLRRYSGRQHVAGIGFVTPYNQKPGYVVFGLVSAF